MGSHNFNTRDATDLGDAGIYILREGQVEKLISTWISGLRIEVSQDGCRIAFASERVVSRKSNSLKTMNLCPRSDK